MHITRSTMKQRASDVICLSPINKIASKFPNSLIAPSISGSTVSAITREKDGRVYANSDNRKAGGVAGF